MIQTAKAYSGLASTIEVRLLGIEAVTVEHCKNKRQGSFAYRVRQRRVPEKRRASSKPMTLAADKAYDTHDFVGALRELKITPHVAQNDRNRSSAINGRTTRHQSYQISQAKRYWVEKPFGWMKSVGPLRKVKLRGREKLWWLFTFTAAAFNLWRIPKLQAAPC